MPPNEDPLYVPSHTICTLYSIFCLSKIPYRILVSRAANIHLITSDCLTQQLPLSSFRAHLDLQSAWSCMIFHKRLSYQGHNEDEYMCL